MQQCEFDDLFRYMRRIHLPQMNQRIDCARLKYPPDFDRVPLCKRILYPGMSDSVEPKYKEKRPVWVKDEDHLDCMHCGAEFTIFTRRHHCRNCGVLVCHNCSSRKRILPDLGYIQPVRICSRCWIDFAFASRRPSDAK